MPKKESASIKSVMLKKEKDGKHPIAIRICWNKKVASRYTGVWIEPQYWVDGEVSRKCPDAASHNILIKKCLTEVENRKLEYESKGIEYSVYDLVNEKAVPKSKLDFQSLFEQLTRERGTGIRNYKLAHLKLSEYYKTKSIVLTDLTAESLQGFAADMHNSGYKNGYINNMLRQISAVWNYAISKRLVSRDDYPLGNDHPFWRKYKPDSNPTALTQLQVEVIINYFIDTYYIIDNSDIVDYKIYPIPKYVDYNEVYSYWFCLNLWLTMYYLQGLAPVDILKLKRSQVSIAINENGEKYFKIKDIHRSKTNVYVPLVVEYNDMTHLLLSPYLNRETDSEWLYPFFDRPSNRPTDPNCTKNFLSTASKNLKRLWKRINIFAEQRKVRDWVPIPNDTTLYSARHSFATHFINKSDNIAALATLLGRSVQNISVYVKQLKDDEYILKQRENVYKKQPY